MSRDNEGQAGSNSLIHLLEEVITNYDRLIQEMKRESECLRKGSTESLLSSIRVIDDYHDAILASEEKIKGSIRQILKAHGGEPKEPILSHVLSILPREEQRKIKNYQQTLRTLKNWTRKINEQNKTFVKEYLGCLNDFLSLVMGSRVEVSGYPQRGARKTATSFPQTLSREV